MRQNDAYFRLPVDYADLIDAYARRRALNPGRALHSHLIINGLVCSSRIASKLIGFYTRCKELEFAQKVFDEIPKSHICGWTAIIVSYAGNGFFRESMGLFGEMRNIGFQCDRIVLPSLLKGCGRLSDLRTGQKLHAIVLKTGFQSDAFVMCGLVCMYSKCGMVGKAKRVFDAMVDRDLVALNAMVSGYVQNGFVSEALGLVKEMNSVKPDIVTWNTLISGFSRANDDAVVTEIFELMQTSGVNPDVVSWTSLISGLAQNFRSKNAFSAFRHMLETGLLPTSATISGLLPASGCIADLRHGREIHGYSIAMGFEKDVYVRSALIDMYAKCGSISEAISLFKGMSERSTVTWNSMIFGYANHGFCNEAIELFHQMLREEGGNPDPDHLTFTAVFTACALAGMVDLGESLFKLMQEKYKIEPRMEHYAIRVDLLGRAGKLAEGYEVIQGMPMKADSFVWGALLGACRQHNCVDLAEIAVKHLQKLEPRSSGSSMILMNLYADYSRWENVIEVRKMMKKRKLRSFPSRSWIEV